MGGDVPRQASSSLPRAPDGPVGQHIRGIYTDRLRQFTANGQYEGQNLISYVSTIADHIIGAYF
jgi:alpha-mannosidase